MLTIPVQHGKSKWHVDHLDFNPFSSWKHPSFWEYQTFSALQRQQPVDRQQLSVVVWQHLCWNTARVLHWNDLLHDDGTACLILGTMQWTSIQEVAISSCLCRHVDQTAQGTRRMTRMPAQDLFKMFSLAYGHGSIVAGEQYSDVVSIAGLTV